MKILYIILAVIALLLLNTVVGLVTLVIKLLPFLAVIGLGYVLYKRIKK